MTIDDTRLIHKNKSYYWQQYENTENWKWSARQRPLVSAPYPWLYTLFAPAPNLRYHDSSQY